MSLLHYVYIIPKKYANVNRKKTIFSVFMQFLHEWDKVYAAYDSDRQEKFGRKVWKYSKTICTTGGNAVYCVHGRAGLAQLARAVDL